MTTIYVSATVLNATSPSVLPVERGKVRRALGRYAVPGAAAIAVFARLPFLTSAPTPDEAGFLLVGQQWHAGGTSLYGNYWVDRPPLLISIFRVAAELGGLLPLRLIGCVATVLIVVGSAHVAQRLAGHRAARWAAFTAAALCVSPLLGALAVNGELLSAPFVVGGIAATLAAVDERREGRAALAAGLAGAAMLTALLVKQNIADVGVFAAAVLILAWRRGEITTPRLGRYLAAFVVGALVCLGLVAAWTMAHGTTLTGVFDAMYPFRVEADRVMASLNRQPANARLWLLLLAWLVSGGALIMAVLTWALVSRRVRGVALWGLIATVVFDVVSIALGGSYWNHYLVQLVVPIAVISGLLVAARQPGTRSVLGAVALVAAIAVAVIVPGSHTTDDSSVGQAVGRVAQTGDTIITAWGHADVTRASGLSSPYPYLWSLPARTLDPRLATFDKVLTGPSAPTWFVARSSPRSFASRGDGVIAPRLLIERYHPVAHLNGSTIYLRNDKERATPQLPGGTTTRASSTPPPVHPSVPL